MLIECPDYSLTALKLLEENGFSAYFVGGCVRDGVIGSVPFDWDVTTSALPEETQKVFEAYRTIPTGLKHGTVTVLIDGHPIEITTMRIDGEYNDNRRPDSVRFTDSIEKDLSRRDFTVNAMAYSHRTGIIDPFGGMKDIESKTIRCVGDPNKRFNEDALRILRALRFASVLGFEIESKTAESIHRNAPLLSNIANERIRVELLKLLCGKNAEKILLDFKDIIFGIIPELKPLDGFEQHSQYHIYDVWTHTVKVVAASENVPVMRFAALLHDVAKPEMFRIYPDGTGHFKGHPQRGAEKSREIMKRLRFSNADIERVCHTIYLHDDFREMKESGAKTQLIKMCSEHGVEFVRSSIKLVRADAQGKHPSFIDEEFERTDIAEKLLEEITEENVCLNVGDLKINGNDIVALGFEGREISGCLEHLLEKVMSGEIQNERSRLLSEAEKLKK